MPTAEEQDGHWFGRPRKGRHGIRHLHWSFCWWAMKLIMVLTQKFSNMTCFFIEYISNYFVTVMCLVCCLLIFMCAFMHILCAI